jgi:hypothetical protein
MRPNRYVILVSILLGIFGIWFSADAVAQYLNTARSFASVDAEYVEGSFVWLDENHERATAEFTIINDSDNDAVLAHFGINLYFDGTFAGARYEPLPRIDLPAGEEVTLEIPFLVPIQHMKPLGSDAELTVRGQMRLEFEGIERPMTVRMSGTIGHVPYEENRE